MVVRVLENFQKAPPSDSLGDFVTETVSEAL